MNEDFEMVCPFCGHTEAEPSTLAGYSVCSLCGGLSTNFSFWQPVTQSHKSAAANTQGFKSGYTLKLLDPMQILLHEQFGISNTRAEQILQRVVNYLSQQTNQCSTSGLFISVGALVTEGAKHCNTPEELVCMVSLTLQYLKNAGYTNSISSDTN